MKHHLTTLLCTILLSACGTGKDDDDGAGGMCSLGSDCAVSEYCLFDYQNGNDPEGGTCIELPEECEGPTTCDDCPELGLDPCPDSVTTACSDSQSGSNPIYSCN